MEIFLFDMDGVLLESQGYHRALQETVRLAAEALGLGGMTLSADDIAAFEAVQMTCEQDSAASSTALLLMEAWRADAARCLPDVLRPAKALPGAARRPDFASFALCLGHPTLAGLTPLEKAARLLGEQDGLAAEQHAALARLLDEARTPQSVLFRTFQELVLGSRDFSPTYGLPAQLHTPSYLLQYDKSLLCSAQRARLLDWLAAPGHAAAILTSRPSLPPEGVFGTPEAELGRELVGLESLPISGWGNLDWLKAQTGVEAQRMLKPDPIHALTALQLALGATPTDASRRAYALARQGEAHPSWRALAGGWATVFEDTPGGLGSLKHAQAALQEAGIALEIRLYGIAQNAIKVEALRVQGARVCDSLSEALDCALGQGVAF